MAARRRISGASSAGEATTTERARPSVPRISSMNSLTSRPRSPTRPTTMISASVKRVIMPSSTLLPTPLPANSPRRWPPPTVSMLLIARMPLGRVDDRTVQADPVVADEGTLAVQRPADAVQQATEHAAAHRQLATAGGGHHTGAGLHALHGIDRHEIDLAAGEADHLGFDPLLPLGRLVDHHAAAADLGLEALGLQGQADHADQPALDHRCRGQLHCRHVAAEPPGKTD